MTADARSIFAELSRLDPKRWRDNAAPAIGNFKATPLMIGGALYFNTPLSIGASVDARTGRTRWIYNPRDRKDKAETRRTFVLDQMGISK